MRRITAVAVLALIACKDPPIVDRGGKSLDVPVPSSGVAATDAPGPENDISAFPRRAKKDPSRIDVKTGPHGAYLVDANGRSLYGFSGDVGGQSACGTACATVWPPVVVKKLPSSNSASVDAAKFGTIARADGSLQLTFAGLPLYYADSDLKPGDTWGHYAMSFGGHFALVGPEGKPLGQPGR